MKPTNLNPTRHYDFQVDDWRPFSDGPQFRHTYAAEVRRDRPVGYWRMGDSGPATLTDQSDHGHDAVAIGTVSFHTSGPLLADGNHAVTLVGDGSHLEMPAAAVPAGDSARSFAGWFQVATTPAADTFMSCGLDASGRAVTIDISTSTIAIDVVGHRLHASGLTLTGWHHIALSFAGPGHDSSAWQLWMDGEPVALTTAAGTPVAMDTAPGVLRVGRHLTTAAGWSGDIDEWAVFDKVLPGPRVRAHYLRALADR